MKYWLCSSLLRRRKGSPELCIVEPNLLFKINYNPFFPDICSDLKDHLIQGEPGPDDSISWPRPVEDRLKCHNSFNFCSKVSKFLTIHMDSWNHEQHIFHNNCSSLHMLSLFNSTLKMTCSARRKNNLLATIHYLMGLQILFSCACLLNRFPSRSYSKWQTDHGLSGQRFMDKHLKFILPVKFYQYSPGLLVTHHHPITPPVYVWFTFL